MRPSKDEYFLRMAALVATRSTCVRRSVGAVAVNAMNHVLATGYNGVPAGLPHCNQHDSFDPIGLPHACKGAASPSGTNLDGCLAVHAEMNALIQCRDVSEIDTMYCTASPCMACTKILLNTGCKRIVFSAEYPHAEARDLWLSTGKIWDYIAI